MTIEPREYIDNDKRMPVTLAGDSGKLLAVGAAETVYEHVPPGATLTGQIIMWPLNTPPAGFLLCDGSAIPVEFTDLIALIGANTPDIVFAKNSKGVGTTTQELEEVGTHGHTASPTSHSHSITTASVGGHSHALSINSNGAHTHSTAGGTGAHTVVSSVSPRNITNYYGTSTGSAGSHNHSGTASSNGAHGHTTTANTVDTTADISDHTGSNQPACTLINFCIRV
jgi:hypothetical protein